MTLRVCSRPGCHELVTTGRCAGCTKQADGARGTATERGYNSTGHRAFRRKVLARDPICVLCHVTPSTTADHYPLDRRTLILKGMNPNAVEHGRGLCKRCHDTETARHQPGGWNARP